MSKSHHKPILKIYSIKVEANDGVLSEISNQHEFTSALM